MEKTSKGPATQKSRRKLLTTLTVGVAAAKLPDFWSKPLVESVLLPAHAVATNESVVSGGGGGPSAESNLRYTPIFDILTPQAHATGSPYPGCATFQWAINTVTNTWVPDSLTLVLLAKRCQYSLLQTWKVLANVKMAHISGGEFYKASGNGHTVILEMINPLAGTGDPFGSCVVNSYLPFDVFRDDVSCSATHSSEAGCPPPS